MDETAAGGWTPERLRSVYEDRVRETARLRDARRAFTAQLGVLPASAVVAVSVLGLAKDANEAVLKVALLLFLLAVAIGWRFSGGDSYRKIRRRIESQMAIDWRNLSPEEWLRAMIKLEEQIYPELERGADRERKGVLLVQAIVAVQVVLVVLALES